MTARLERCTESDIEALRAISMETFVEAFGEQNTTEDMEQYLRTTLSQGALLAELQTAGSEFYLAIVDGMVAGYLKINTGSAQNEAMGERALEVERIYTTCKGQGLGALMMNHAIIGLVVLPVFLARYFLARYFQKWIDGYTGDCLGATQQVCEVIFYLTLLAIWKFI